MRQPHKLPPAESDRLWRSGPQMLERLCFDHSGPQYTLTEVAKLVGVARGYLSDVLNAKSRVSVACEAHLAGLLYSELVGADQW